MLSLKKYKSLTSLFIFSLILVKLLTLIDLRITNTFFIIWSLPFIFFYFQARSLSIKAYQGFCFILLIYFMSSSLRVFGVDIYIYDLLELILVVLFFIHCMFGPKTIRKYM
ncbi:DUF2069 domain-containing protein [Gammaproteobacteria bacterium]|nr:DUF2069 domain-containing protein [Gammaproteobacteria bacterium]